MKHTVMALATMMFFLACSKKNTSIDQGPVITLNTPSDNQVFTAGQTVTVAGSFTDLDKIQQTQIHVENKSTSAQVLHVEDHPGAVSSTLSGTFVAAAGVTYKIELEAIDVAGNESKVEVTVTGK